VSRSNIDAIVADIEAEAERMLAVCARWRQALAETGRPPRP